MNSSSADAGKEQTARLLTCLHSRQIIGAKTQLWSWWIGYFIVLLNPPNRPIPVVCRWEPQWRNKHIFQEGNGDVSLLVLNLGSREAYNEGKEDGRFVYPCRGTQATRWLMACRGHSCVGLVRKQTVNLHEQPCDRIMQSQEDVSKEQHPISSERPPI